MGSFFRRLVFAYHYRDINLLISGLIDSNSKILINRDIATRVRKAAPFLIYDKDPYTAIVDGHLVWIQDAYTSTDSYPYSQRTDLSGVTNDDIRGQVNYMRNSVKAVVDAYNGTLTFYVSDPTDPLIQVWERAFPTLFTPMSQASPDLTAHFRYPEDLFQVQSSTFARYHVTDVPTFFANSRRWAVPDALPSSVGGETNGTLRPYYVLIRLPGTTDEQFVLFMPFTPPRRPNMVAYLAAGSDPGHYGELTAFQFPAGLNVDGPQQVRSLVNQDAATSQQISLLSQQGSNVLFGDLIIVPIEDAFLYVQPLYVVSTGNPPIPQLKRVVVIHGGNVTIASSLSGAISASFGAEVPPPTGGQQPPPTGTVQQLLQQAVAAFARADAALRAGDLATYQREIQTAQQLIQQANALAGGGGTTPSPTPTPTPSVTPTASPSG
jgi:uncharacterized membrane protein (UPF0182 family)